MGARKGLGVISTAGRSFFDDEAMLHGAALAFYSALSLAPLLILILAAAAFLGEDTQQQIVEEIEQAVGPEASEGVGMVIRNVSEEPGRGRTTSIVGIVFLLFAATGVFAQLQHSLNMIWGVRRKKGGAKAFIQKRLASLLLIIAIGVLLIASLAASTAAGMVVGTQGTVWQAIDIGLSLLVFVALFAVIFRLLPDVQIEWKDVGVGATVTAVLFLLGRYGIGMYLGRSAIGSAYGAAGAFLVLLLWVYYSALILLFGAELTQAYARAYGTRIEPQPYAEWRDAARRDEDSREAGTGGKA